MMKLMNLVRDNRKLLFWFILTLLMAIVPWFVI
jgi:hypothetical protein